MPSLSTRGLILASGSSRRHFLLEQLNLRYSIQVPDVDETKRYVEKSDEYVLRLAQAKAQAVANSVKNFQAILAADTIITKNEEIIGKPVNVHHAKGILNKLSGTEHIVQTGLILLTQNCDYKKIVKTRVKFKALTKNEINAYCLTSEPFDKAGAYAVQGYAARFIEYLSGSYTNVIGLPLKEVADLLKKANLDFSRFT
jgi:septum formation protein